MIVGQTEFNVFNNPEHTNCNCFVLMISYVKVNVTIETVKNNYQARSGICQTQKQSFFSSKIV